MVNDDIGSIHDCIIQLDEEANGGRGKGRVSAVLRRQSVDSTFSGTGPPNRVWHNW